MKVGVLRRMICPYCLGRFEVSRIAEQQDDRILFGLIRCRCFEFPIVEGVLLLSLSKGYGGTEEALQPYTPLLVAAVEFLRKDEPAGLRKWIGRHIPLLSLLLGESTHYYLDFVKLLEGRLQQQVERDMFQLSRYEFLGKKGYLRQNEPVGLVPTSLRRLWSTRLGTLLNGVRKRFWPAPFESFYVSRFVSPDIATLRSRLSALPLGGPILSLCCGHGAFELILRVLAPQTEVVSIDAQILNVFVTKKYVHPEGNYICHDVQFPLPFPDGGFQATFSSACLGEIPSQATFVKEAIRVTAEAGWTMFDSVWTGEQGRIQPMRFYRICQNQMANFVDYYQLIRDCAGDRGVRCLGASAASVNGMPWWQDDAEEVLDRLRRGDEKSMAFAVTGTLSQPRRCGSAVRVQFSPRERAYLCVNPRYEVDCAEDGTLRARLRRGDEVSGLWSPAWIKRSELSDPAYLEEIYRSGLLVLLPPLFSRDVVRMFPSPRISLDT